ncbi:PIN domain-containing protein [Microbacterium protaetiae]|uniref:Ribonuclease VapC n=1 Tax=Microbacterium protaetiae TaxID=2509458 RepID=A0A4P6ECJ1_9MICO|nr:type II toxin-antitoxin system VapC family toxin [Microbacterium protaetiae]QAY59952.1 PIN domain-containing protein [Microbacterium protaetiae]
MIVLDASAAVEWLLGRSGARFVAERIADPDVSIHAPAPIGVEVVSALRGLTLRHHMSADRGAAAIADLAAAGVDLHDPTPLLPRAWQLRANLSAYDAVYVALAEVLDATLLTTDARIARAPGIAAEVVVVPTGK